MKSSPRSPQLEKARAQPRRPNAAKNKNKINLLKKNFLVWIYCILFIHSSADGPLGQFHLLLLYIMLL